MKKSLLTLIITAWAFSMPVSAQWIYSQGFAAITGAPELQRIHLVDQAIVRLVGMGDMGDIAFHPDQRLFGVVFDKVYLIDTVTSAYSEVYDIGDFQSVGMTIDYGGKMYFSGYNPNTNRYGIVIYNPATSDTRMVADFGPINQGFINDLEFYNGELYVVGELPSTFPEPSVLFRVDTSGLNHHDTIVTYHMWPGRALAAVNDSCGSQFLVSPATSILNYFYPPADSVRSVSVFPSDGLFYSSGATSRTAHLGSVSPLRIMDIELAQDPCTGNSNAEVRVNIQPGRQEPIQYSIDGIQFQNDPTFFNVPPGQYQCNVRDGWGCEKIQFFEISDITAFPVDILTSSATCGEANGKISIQSSAPGLYYALDDFQFQLDTIFGNLSGGDHTLVIRNDAGCSDTMLVHVMSGDAPSFDIINTDEQCGAQNGTIEFINLMGEFPLQFSMDGISWQTQAKFETLTSGLYTLYCRDKFDCIVREDVDIHETGTPEIVNITIVHEECGEVNGQIEITVISPHIPLQYALNGGEYQSDVTFMYLESGAYIIAVKDSFGCIVKQEVEVISIGGPVIDSIRITNEFCKKMNGQVQIHAVSDYGPLYYSMDQSPFTSEPDFNNLAAGQYIIMVEDANQCQVYDTVSVQNIPAVEIDTLMVDPALCGDHNGRIQIIPGSGTVTSYSLDGHIFQPTSVFQDLAPGSYPVYLKSYEVCIDSADVIIQNVMSPLIDHITLIQPSCNGPESSITIKALGTGELVYTLDGKFSNSSGTFSELSEGEHHIIISDPNGCSVDTSLLIPDADCSFYIPNIFSPNQDGINDDFRFFSQKPEVHLIGFDVYDRWGTMVYSCKASSQCQWDGTNKGHQSPEGVYLYQLSFFGRDRTTSSHWSGDIVEIMGSDFVL